MQDHKVRRRPLLKIPAAEIDIFSQDSWQELRQSARTQAAPFVIAVVPTATCFHFFEGRELLRYWQSSKKAINPCNRVPIEDSNVSFYAEIPQFDGHLRYVGQYQQAVSQHSFLSHLLAIKPEKVAQQQASHWLALASRVCCGYWRLHLRDRCLLIKCLLQNSWLELNKTL